MGRGRVLAVDGGVKEGDGLHYGRPGVALCSRPSKDKDIREQVVLKQGDVLTVPHCASDLPQGL